MVRNSGFMLPDFDEEVAMMQSMNLIPDLYEIESALTSLNKTLNQVMQHDAKSLQQKEAKDLWAELEQLTEHYATEVKMGAQSIVLQLLEGFKKVVDLSANSAKLAQSETQTPAADLGSVDSSPLIGTAKVVLDIVKPHWREIVAGMLVFVKLARTDKAIGCSVAPAMGARGIGIEDSSYKYVSDGTITLTDQSKWLFSHSAMKIPSADIMTHIYKTVIMSKSGLRQFGQYQL